MSSTAASAAGDVVLPALPPIRTATAPWRQEEEEEDRAARSSPAASSSSTAESSRAPSSDKREEEEAAAKGSQQEEPEEPTTPTWEASRIQPPTECPPAPRKPAWAPSPAALGAKRKFLLPSSTSSSPPLPRPPAFFPVTRDLSTVFRALPPKKRIRAG